MTNNDNTDTDSLLIDRRCCFPTIQSSTKKCGQYFDQKPESY
jgi:hypothetical protein